MVVAGFENFCFWTENDTPLSLLWIFSRKLINFGESGWPHYGSIPSLGFYKASLNKEFFFTSKTMDKAESSHTHRAPSEKGPNRFLPKSRLKPFVFVTTQILQTNVWYSSGLQTSSSTPKYLGCFDFFRIFYNSFIAIHSICTILRKSSILDVSLHIVKTWFDPTPLLPTLSFTHHGVHFGKYWAFDIAENLEHKFVQFNFFPF